MTNKFIEETFNSYFSDIVNSGCTKDQERLLRAALMNVERDARHSATTEVFKLANILANKEHYEG